jgi:hypothetical protein
LRKREGGREGREREKEEEEERGWGGGMSVMQQHLCNWCNRYIKHPVCLPDRPSEGSPKRDRVWRAVHICTHSGREDERGQTGRQTMGDDKDRQTESSNKSGLQIYESETGR